ncbi:septal ring lytic transglycosylase RlpA family protein [Siccirubricoccus sp. G192]|uniref:septal ring lytic transglycosylase RlpA family protein n=1 Tax=Siccirubricoccus sp. G192 TaxID=2849651 RepID=UPI001C2C86DE|nr:RlpA-like double-psi beta-barrel domain-containing protein [Siccirubricoccus sp. G192]MBV1798376.1 SPOR domain-containing protein [Siccirubricoccus sp. G192]
MRLPALLIAAALAACARTPPPPQPEARYTVGKPYAMGGVWSYPREDFALSETGIASVLPDARPGRRTANGEIHDPALPSGAHRTLQLPVILTVRNLENGREIRLRVNDRGPARPGRILGLSRRAAELLGVPAGGAAQVRITVEEGPSRALARALPGTENAALPISTAPRGVVEAESLAPPPGARSAERVRQAMRAPVVQAEIPEHAPPPERLPETVAQHPVTPGHLLIEAGTFFRRDLAQRQAARLAAFGGRVEATGSDRQPQFRVKAGPFASLAAADQAVEGALAAGLPEVKLVVE